MADRATIWQKKPDGWRGVYLDRVGDHPGHAGATLAAHYDTEEKIDSLLDPVFNDYKYLSTLGNTPAECVYKHDAFSRRQNGVLTADGRVNASKRWHAEYMYERNGDKWQFTTGKVRITMTPDG